MSGFGVTPAPGGAGVRVPTRVSRHCGRAIVPCGIDRR